MSIRLRVALVFALALAVAFALGGWLFVSQLSAAMLRSTDAALAARTALAAITASQCTAPRRLASGRSSHRRAVTGSGVWGGDPLPRPRRHIPSTLAGAQPLDDLDQPQQPLTADYRTPIHSLTTHRCTLPSNSLWSSVRGCTRRCGRGRPRGRPGW